MIRNPALRDHVAAGILDVAATVLAEQGAAASMTDIAKAAGVGRATLYRYFPNRDALVQALVDAALADLDGKIADANLDAVPVDEAFARVTRAVMTVAGKYRSLAVIENRVKKPEGQPLVGMLRTIIDRGVEDGTFRTDLPTATLLAAYSGLLRGASSLVVHNQLGIEETSAAMTAIFLDGVHRA
jgi:TetR/AcrR family transcriptional repressor of mexCD-oprJ operon